MSMNSPINYHNMRSESRRAEKIVNMNSPINYPFPYKWSSDGMSGQPIVNPLMKAIIEENITEMYSLVKNGASIHCLDEGTLGRVLFNKITNYQIAKFFVDCGGRGYFINHKMYKECYDDYGYISGGMALAYYYNANNVFKILAENGFKTTSICFNGQGFDLLDLIKRRDDVNALKFLLENGFNRSHIEWEFKNCSGYCSKFLLDNPVVHRKSSVLEFDLCADIRMPNLKTPKFLHKKENNLILEDYKDRINAKRKFLNSISEEDRKNIS